METIDFKKDIVNPAWELINTDLKIKAFYFFPGLFSTIFTTTLLVYQFLYTYVVIFNKKQQFFESILTIFHSQYLLEIIVWIIIFFILYYLSSPIFEAWLIKYLDEKEKNQKMSSIDAIWFWTTKFLQIFQYNNIFSEFKFFFVFTSYLFLIRFVWVEYIKYINIASFTFLIIAMIINTLFSYSKYEIVLENKWVFRSAWVSKQISVLNLKTTIKLYFLMFLINIRVIFNFLIFLFFPILFAVTIYYITSKIFLTIAIIVLVILFIFIILFLWYLTAVLDVFKTTVWYYAYKNWRIRAEREIEEDD